MTDTGAGTPSLAPLPPFELREAIIDAVRGRDPIAAIKAFDAYDEWWHTRSRPAKTPPDPFDPDQRYLEDRPATDPAGLDPKRLRYAFRAFYTERGDIRGITPERLAAEYARLSVADGPGPEEPVRWPRWECSSCHRNAKQCGERGEGYGGACCNDCDHDR